MSVAQVSRRLFGFALWLTLATPAAAATVTVQWDANPEPDVTNYNVFVRTANGAFGAGIPVGNQLKWTFVGLQHGVQYYFAVQAQSPSGVSALSQVSYITPPLVWPGTEPTRSDFNSDGLFDLLWHHQETGKLTTWHMNGPNVLFSRYLTPDAADPSWKVRGSGDFNGDGEPDLVWQNISTGEVLCWFMDGVLQFSAGWFNPTAVDANWEIASVRDFNSDNRPDLVWTNPSTGQVVVWYLNGTTRIGQEWLNATPLPDPTWKVRGTGDFNGDQKPDLLWQHDTNGQPVVWFMNGATQVSAALLPGPGSGDWTIRAVGDTNLDWWPDVIFHNRTTGGVVIWALQGTTIVANQWLGIVDPTWKIAAPR